MKILVAGSEGFIGQKVCGLLEGMDIRHYYVDLKCGTDVCNVIPGVFDVIILLAADLGRDEKMYRNNLRIYEWAARQSAHIVYASSAAVYPDGMGSSEAVEPAPPTLYGESKLLGETIIKATQPSYTILRLANVYGNGEGNGAIDAFKRGENQIYGDGADVRDYVSVDVVANAFARTALDPRKYRNEVYNISSSKPLTTLEAFKLHGTGEPNFVPPREYDTRYSLLLNEKAIQAGLI